MHVRPVFATLGFDISTYLSNLCCDFPTWIMCFFRICLHMTTVRPVHARRGWVCIFMETEFLMNKNSNICSSCQTFSAQSILHQFTLEISVIKFFFDWFTLSWSVIAWNQYRSKEKIWKTQLAESVLSHVASTNDNARQAQIDRQARVVNEFERTERIAYI